MNNQKKTRKYLLGAVAFLFGLFVAGWAQESALRNLERENLDALASGEGLYTPDCYMPIVPSNGGETITTICHEMTSEWWITECRYYGSPTLTARQCVGN